MSPSLPRLDVNCSCQDVDLALYGHSVAPFGIGLRTIARTVALQVAEMGVR